MSGHSKSKGKNKNKGDKPKEMKKDELTEEEMQYSHGAETDLSVMVVNASTPGRESTLRDYLQYAQLTKQLHINEVDSKNFTALFFAIWTKKASVVKLLVDLGADVNHQDFMGFTPLFWATGRYPSVEVAKCLLEDGSASVHISTNKGATALHGAALESNTGCVKLLLKHGADPRAVTHAGTTPFDLAEKEAVRALLHKSARHTDKAIDDSGESCAQCSKTSSHDGNLKRCSRCHVTLYCGRECQKQHWKAGHKQNCCGFVIARSNMDDLGLDFVVTISQVKGAKNPKTVSVKQQFPGDQRNPNFLKRKQFVVKVQVQIGVSDGGMMVYNEDRSVSGFITADTTGYRELQKRIYNEGYMSVKAFFWAELCADSETSFKVFHGKCAPFQTW